MLVTSRSHTAASAGELRRDCADHGSTSWLTSRGHRRGSRAERRRRRLSRCTSQQPAGGAHSQPPSIFERGSKPATGRLGVQTDIATVLISGAILGAGRPAPKVIAFSHDRAASPQTSSPPAPYAAPGPPAVNSNAAGNVDTGEFSTIATSGVCPVGSREAPSCRSVRLGDGDRGSGLASPN